MRPLPPPKDLPSNVSPAKFSAPPELDGTVNDIYGLIHVDEKGETQALEFQFELSKDEIKVLRHEPYITLTILADHLHPFALQTSVPYEDKYDTLIEHQHICTQNVTHEKDKWWRCDNPAHNSKESKGRIRTCNDCWEAMNSGRPEPDLLE